MDFFVADLRFALVEGLYFGFSGIGCFQHDIPQFGKQRRGGVFLIVFLMADTARYDSYNAGFSFVRDLEAVEERLSKWLSAKPAQAVGLYETFLAGCHEKAVLTQIPAVH